MKEKDPKQIAEAIAAKHQETTEKALRELSPRSIGRHVIFVLTRGEVLTLDNLLTSLQIEADSPDAEDKDRKIALYAIDWLKRLI